MRTLSGRWESAAGSPRLSASDQVAKRPGSIKRGMLFGIVATIVIYYLGATPQGLFSTITQNFPDPLTAALIIFVLIPMAVGVPVGLFSRGIVRGVRAGFVSEFLGILVGILLVLTIKGGLQAPPPGAPSWMVWVGAVVRYLGFMILSSIACAIGGGIGGAIRRQPSAHPLTPGQKLALLLGIASLLLVYWIGPTIALVIDPALPDPLHAIGVYFAVIPFLVGVPVGLISRGFGRGLKIGFGSGFLGALLGMPVLVWGASMAPTDLITWVLLLVTLSPFMGFAGIACAVGAGIGGAARRGQSIHAVKKSHSQDQ